MNLNTLLIQVFRGKRFWITPSELTFHRFGRNIWPTPVFVPLFILAIKQSHVSGQVQVGAMVTMARMLRQILSNRIM